MKRNTDARKQVENALVQLVNDLREYADALENLYHDLDDLTEEEYDQRALDIEAEYFSKIY